MTIEMAVEKRLDGNFRLEVAFRTDGACLGVLGPSGGGKSMTLKCLAGVETPDRGRIAVNGRVLFDSTLGINVKPQERRIGYLFQNYALFPRMSAEQNIGIGAKGNGDAKRQRIRGLIKRFRLDGLEARHPDQLSGGQQQRVALARMLAAEPEVILLDEPFSALDTHLREEMQTLLVDVLEHRPDAIMVSHSRDEIYRLCPELLALDGGRVLARGGTRRLFADPGTLRLARLTGCENISRLERIGGNRLFAADWGLTLDAARPIPADAAFVGVRARDLEPACRPETGLVNVIALNVREQSEDLHEWNVQLVTGGGGDPSRRGEMRWTRGKQAIRDLPEFLRVPPEALLFLRDGKGTQ